MNLDRFVTWERKLALRRSAVLFITLWMTWRAFAWAAAYASAATVDGDSAIAVAAMIAAVTAPISALQAAVFRAYIDSKGPQQ
jgi:hypothetical protein